MGKKCLDFGDHDLIFKVTPALCQSLTKKSLFAHPLEPNDGFWPNFIYCIIGIVKRLDFGDIGLIFKVTSAL